MCMRAGYEWSAVCIFIHTNTHTCIYTYNCVDIYIYIYIHTSIHPYRYVHTYTSHLCCAHDQPAPLQIWVYVCIHVCGCVYFSLSLSLSLCYGKSLPPEIRESICRTCYMYIEKNVLQSRTHAQVYICLPIIHNNIYKRQI